MIPLVGNISVKLFIVDGIDGKNGIVSNPRFCSLS